MPAIGTSMHWVGRLGRSLWGAARRAASIGNGFVPPAPVLSGTFVTPHTALSLTAVYSAINCISKDLGCLPCNLYTRMADGGLFLDPTDYFQELLGVEADDQTSALKFTLDGSGHTLGWGNGLAEITRSGRGEPEQVHILHPAKTIPKFIDGRLIYELENKQHLLPENVLHFAGLGFDGIRGYTPITVARQSIGLGIAAEQFGAALFGNGAIPKGVLRHPKRLSEAAANSLRRSWNQVHQGSQSAHQTAILEEGMDWTNTQINPEDAQFLQTREFQVKEIARLYNLPPHKIGDYSESHLANVEEANLDYLVSTLAFWVTVRERELNRRLLTRDGRRRWVILYDLKAMMRANTSARTTYYQTLRNLGVLSADDIRKAEGLNPIGAKRGGDKYLVQAQYQPLEKAGESPPKPAPAPAPAPKAEETPAAEASAEKEVTTDE